MCLVVDANCAADLAKQEKPHYRCLMAWINEGGRIVSGGALERELVKVGAMRGLLNEWSRRGNLVQLPKPKVDALANQLSLSCKSNDAHVLAVTILGKADIIVTEDKGLIQDVKNRNIVRKKIRIYKENSASPARVDRHVKLLLSADCP